MNHAVSPYVRKSTSFAGVVFPEVAALCHPTVCVSGPSRLGFNMDLTEERERGYGKCYTKADIIHSYPFQVEKRSTNKMCSYSLAVSSVL